LGKGKAGFLLQLLGANAQELYAAAKTPGTSLGHCRSVVTLVADQSILSRMVTESDLATLAAQHQAAAATLNETSCSPPIEKQNNLFFIYYSFIYCLFKQATENTPIASLELVP
jgi:hypothetical protein